MRHIELSEIKDLKTYSKMREDVRSKVLQEKARRRVHLGDYFTFLFENRLTIWYQIQEMIFNENLTRSSEIQHEFRTFVCLNLLNRIIGVVALTLVDESHVRRK